MRVVYLVNLEFKDHFLINASADVTSESQKTLPSAVVGKVFYNSDVTYCYTYKLCRYIL